MYIPVAAQCLLLGLRYRSMSLPLIANPGVPLSGMAGVPKSSILELAGPTANRSILPWVVVNAEPGGPVSSRPPGVGGPGGGRKGPLQFQGQPGVRSISESAAGIEAAILEQAISAMARAGLGFPVVGKPDIGCRGAGVKLLCDREALTSYLGRFPPGARVLLQQLADFEAEAGVFYVRDPDSEQGRITSLTLKYTPYVVGDGVHTLAELVAADPRAGGLLHLYRERNAEHWYEIIPDNSPYRLVFSASHCRGAVFRDGRRHITAELTRALNRIFDDIPGFYYGRLDIKFRDVESLQAGRDLQIVEINGASSESIHIWDRRTRFRDAAKTLLQQYRTLFKLGEAHYRRGRKPPGLWPLYKAWRHELQLVKRYPAND